MEKDKEKAVDQAISQIERQFGKGSIMKMGEENIIRIPAISTGSLSLDLALGVGGVPRGRVDRDIRARIVRKNHLDAAYRGRSPGKRRYGSLYRCGTCP